MKRNPIRSAFIVMAAVFSAMLASCGQYHELPFGGMNGRVQKVTMWHLMPEMWYAGNRGSDIMYITASIYDVYGHEICSAVMDSTELIQAEAESMYDGDVCIRSIQKAGNKTVARINLISNKRGTLEYSKEMNGRTVRMTVKESSFGRRHKSVVSEDGKVTTVSVVVTDRHGYPVKITTTESETGNKTVETNMFDENHNITEKHVVTYYGEDGTEKEEITYIEYGGMDEYGNWTDCRTYNDFRLPVEVVFREFEYWE